MKKYRSLAGMILGFLLLAWMSKTCYAEIADVTAFENLEWKKVHEEALIAPQGVVQSICATKNYIICIENTNDAQDTPDTVSAYYKNDTDADGNPVEQYSLALRNTDNNWEHGNGMAYNQAKEEIYVAPYTSQNPENRGCLFVMDANTLAYKGKIKISDDYNILGIGYFVDENQRKASQSTSYFEFQKGHYTTCWCENSINICTWLWDEYEMSGLIRQVIKDFDYYGITEVTKKQWNRLVELSKATSAKAEPILMEAASWAEECFKENEVFTIIGM